MFLFGAANIRKKNQKNHTNTLCKSSTYNTFKYIHQNENKIHQIKYFSQIKTFFLNFTPQIAKS